MSLWECECEWWAFETCLCCLRPEDKSGYNNGRMDVTGQNCALNLSGGTKSLPQSDISLSPGFITAFALQKVSTDALRRSSV